MVDCNLVVVVRAITSFNSILMGQKRTKIYTFMTEARGGGVFEALRYKPAGREFDSRFCNWNFSVT
jgi:hypothetical protein